jgi:hypothetical protein
MFHVCAAGLKRYFSTFGTVESAQVMYNRDTAKSRGFGFVVFTDEDAVDRVLDLGTYHELDDKEVEIKRSVPKSGQQTMAAKPVAAASAPAPAPVVAPAPAPVPVPVVNAPTSTDASKASVWKGKKDTPVAPKTISKGASWVSAVVGNSTSSDNSLAAAQPTSSPAAPSIAPLLSSAHSSPPLASPHAQPVLTPATHKPALAAPTALGLGMDIVGGSSIADLLKNSLSSSLPSPALSAASSTAIGSEKLDNKPSSPGGAAFGNYPQSARLPSELPSLLSLQSLGGPGGNSLTGGLGATERAGLRQGGRDPSWDLADGTSASDSALGFSGGDSVVSTLTTEELEHDGLSGDGKGRRVRGVDLGLYSSLPTQPHGAPQNTLPPPPMPLPHEMAANPFLGAGFPHSMFNSPVYHSFQSDAQSALLASMAAAALRMYQPWAGQPQAPIPPYAPQSAPLSMPPAFPAGPGGPPGLNNAAPAPRAPAAAADHPSFQPFPAYHRL